MPERCRKCPTMIMMLAHFETGNLNPIEVEPALNGNLVVNREKNLYRFATKAEKELAAETGKNLYISHFAKCVHAQSFRRQ